MKQPKFPAPEFRGPGLLERILLVFKPLKKKAVVDTDEDLRKVYTLTYKVLGETLFIRGFKEGLR